MSNPYQSQNHIHQPFMIMDNDDAVLNEGIYWESTDEIRIALRGLTGFERDVYVISPPKSGRILSVGNYIASFVRRNGSHPDFKKIVLPCGDTYNILTDGDANTESVWVLEDDSGHLYATRDCTIAIKQLDGSTVPVKIESLFDTNKTNSRAHRVSIPANGIYLKNEVLNTIFKEEFVPFDFCRSIIPRLLKALRRERRLNKNWQVRINIKTKVVSVRYKNNVQAKRKRDGYGVILLNEERLSAVENLVGHSVFS